MKSSLIIRADASSSIGIGHVMRCFALAQAWQDCGGHVIFATSMNAPAVSERLLSEGMEIFRISAEPGTPDDAVQTADLAQEVGSDWVIVDGYQFGSNYQKIIKDYNLRLFFIDDYGHSDHYYADIVMNQNIYANENLYSKREHYTKLLLGTRYVLLRREFLSWRGWKRGIPEVARNILVTLGGSDPANVTLKVIRALSRIENFNVVVVLGGCNIHHKDINDILDNNKHFLLKRDVKNMPELMAWADLAISSAGTTAWELSFMGLPSLLLIIAENQAEIAEQLTSTGVALSLGWHDRISSDDLIKAVCSLSNDKNMRFSMSEIGRKTVDGFGVNRVLEQILDGSVWLRPACENDCKQIYEWANDPESRRASFSTDYISWNEHILWFRRKICDPQTVFYVAYDGWDRPLGIVRFDLGDLEATINLNLCKSGRGRGLASLIIDKSVKRLFAERHIFKVNAFIKPNNIKSIRAFERSGFIFQGNKTIKGNIALHYVLISPTSRRTNESN